MILQIYFWVKLSLGYSNLGQNWSCRAPCTCIL